ncbi:MULTISPECIES: methyl-accepting chemotaxis protein [unclassified Brenneria]|uniref:methyl-accepting chemotaxis protein n=1 Tax=unclassified Brenneria TaxID=2634434 RepID=UPI0029C20F8F|nr:MULTISPECIES: methyl-accepting chemotaxis protein [unclassified Brenneria]MDX5628842.1 methyl-accepting chemotaxis protein [Brenneria sp. L3-3Z]MDX5695981.1 methyl-accepting chemotaxis protein [Brenneria sp. L4-2C]MEE3661271.1 methyl-accepting chemotaxis protein [Brenneria sp. g21c3]
MRLNTPVTQQEYLLDMDTILMSTTDTKSHITYANSAFINVSGFSESELLNQPHNIVRHPDMPVEAFADMWFTLKQGDSWTGLVKNRRNNGDYYWVRANVTPVYHQNQLTGYISVRNTPSADEIKLVEPLYAAMKKKQAGKRKFYKGLVIRSGIFSPLSLLQKLSVRWRLRLAVLTAGIIPALLALVGINPLWLAALTLPLILLLDAFLQQQIARPLKTILKQAQDVVSGRKGKTIRLNRVDEIGLLMRAVNQFGLNLHSLVDDVGTQVKGMTEVSHRLAENNIALNTRTEETSANLQQTAAAIEQITAAVQQSSETAAQATQMAETASRSAIKGGEIMKEAIGMMDSISTTSNKIVDIISVIDSIAFQTNILALNAAVEAARAGVQGKGFAVVATEVRNLAQHSASAAKEIKALINDNVKSVKSGEERVENAGRHISDIVNEALQVATMIKEISHAAQEQTSALGLINTSIAHIEEMTQRNTDMVAQSTETAEGLNNQAKRLNSAINVYGR